MRPYGLPSPTEYPDVDDIKTEGRASHVGKLGHGRGYCAPAGKARARRTQKRRARANGRVETYCREE